MSQSASSPEATAFVPSARFSRVIAAIDAANADDPRQIVVDGVARPYEHVYSERMGEVLQDIYPQACELLRIAAHAQHIRRWDIPRDDYEKGREGYNRWRRACREHHASLIGEIMAEAGYQAEEIAQVQALLKKEKLKKDARSQALENVVDVVFLKYYWDEFVRKYAHFDDDKLIDVIGKTLRKMSGKGHAAALALELPAKTRKLVEAALAREADTLAKLAKVQVELE